MKYRFIGDVHGEMQYLPNLLDKDSKHIQVGDMGMGFCEPQLFDSIVDGYDFRYIRGNHDSPSLCKNDPKWIVDGTVEQLSPSVKAMYIGGALSIDRDWRTTGLDWWPDEELSYGDFYNLMDVYEKEKPEIVITHAIGTLIAHRTLSSVGRTFYGIPSVTENAFEEMRHIHKPKMWIFGHYHTPFDQVVDGTRFICIPPLEVIDLEIS